MTNFFFLAFTSFPRPWQISFQKPATTMMEGIIDLHHDIFTFLIIILIFVSFMMGTLLYRYFEKTWVLGQTSFPTIKFRAGHGITHNTTLEIVWTIIPTLILLLIATPSFALIYALDEIVEPELTIRVIGRQWYWTYEYPDTVALTIPWSDMISEDDTFLRSILTLDSSVNTSSRQSSLPIVTDISVDSLVNLLLHDDLVRDVDSLVNLLLHDDLVRDKVILSHLELTPSAIALTLPGFSFNSYIIPTEDLFPGAFRLLEVDRRLVLPFGTNIRVLVTSYDVLHSWAVPAFGIKVDAVPGRMNEYFLNINYLGLFYGQCSEICGVNHGFMPIKVEVTTEEQFRWWFARTSLLENSPLKFLSIWQVDPEISKFSIFPRVKEEGV